MPGTGSAYLKDGSGTRQPGPYTKASICSGCAGAGNAKPCSSIVESGRIADSGS